MLCQMERCWRYTEKFSRVLIVDGSKAGFLDDFSRYFDLAGDMDGIQLSLEESMADMLNDLDTVPPEVKGRLNGYAARWDPQLRKFVDVETSALLSFDFYRPHEAGVLVHQQCGGGNDSIRFLARLRLSEEIASEIRARIAGIGQEYLAIHVRNSDVTTDYQGFFESIRGEVADRKVLVCSDSAQVKAFAVDFFDRSEVVTLTDTPDTGGRRLHENRNLPRFETNRDMLIDLFALAGAQKLFVTRHEDKGPLVGRISGFARLALALNERRDIWRSVLGIRDGG